MMSDARLNQAIWIMPGKRQDELQERGWLAPRTYSEVLPNSARSYELEWAGENRADAVVKPVDTPVIRMELTHSGQGAPWEALGSRGVVSVGTVRILENWTCEGTSSTHAVDLPRSMFPGESVFVDLPLPEEWLGDAATCTVSIGLIEEGVGPFSQGSPVELTVQSG